MTTHWILGAGAIGRLLAHSLSPTTTTLLIGRRALPSRQVLTSPNGESCTQSLRVLTAAELSIEAPEPPLYVHIATKAMAAEAALNAVASLLPPSTPLVLWQNGFLAQPRLTQRWIGPVLCATTTEGAYVVSEAHIVHAGRGHTFVGDLHRRYAALAQALASCLSDANMAATAVDDIRDRLWQKLAVNAAINPLVALHGIRNGELRAAPYAARVEAVIAEVATIMQAEGIASPSSEEHLAAWRALVWGVIERTANNKASMLQDVEAGRVTEREAILAPLIAAGRRHALPCRVLTSLDDALAKLEP